MKKVFIVLSVLIVQSCGYFDNDDNQVKERITNRINITKRENNSFYELVSINENGEVNYIINEDCIYVLYDSIKKVIYTEKYLNPYNSSYKKVIILNETTNNSLEAFDVVDLTKEQYLIQIKKCKNCMVKFDTRAAPSNE